MPKLGDIYIANISCLQDKKLFAGQLAALSAERQRKVMAMASEKNRCLTAGAGVLLNVALRKYGIDGKMAKICYNTYGKPFLHDYHIYFSLSHSGDYVFCAVSDEEIGVDIQRHANYRQNVVKRFFHPAEQAYISSLSLNKRAAAFFRLWTLKESCAKMLGTSLAKTLSSVSVQFTVQAVVAHANGQKLPCTFNEYNLDGYSAAVCSKKEGQAEPLQWVDLAE